MRHLYRLAKWMLELRAVCSDYRAGVPGLHPHTRRHAVVGAASPKAPPRWPRQSVDEDAVRPAWAPMLERGDDDGSAGDVEQGSAA